MIEDEVMREIRANREAFAAAHNYDLAAMAEARRQMARLAGVELVSLPPRRPEGWVEPAAGPAAGPAAEVTPAAEPAPAT